MSTKSYETFDSVKKPNDFFASQQFPNPTNFAAKPLEKVVETF